MSGECEPVSPKTNKWVVVSDGKTSSRVTLMEDARGRMEVIIFNSPGFNFKIRDKSKVPDNSIN